MIGRTISHYKILEKLGVGGMGVVYKAEDTKLGRLVALKFLNPQTIGAAEEKTRFRHEAQAAAALNHANICTVYEIDEADGDLFIAMELVRGQSLKSKVRAGPLKLGEAINITIQVAEGLHAAQVQGIVHRDIKPANIMVTPEGRAKIMDFGLAKSKGRTKLTQTGSTIGTVSYMSPEQARGQEVDSRTDLWSLGVILYEMITGRLPFEGEFEQAVIYSILNEEPEPVTALRTGVPRELERIINKALAKNPDERYRHADELLVDLRSIKKKSSAPKRAIRTSVARQAVIKRAYLYIGLAVMAALLILSRFDFFAGDKDVIDSIAVLPLENLSGDPAKEYFADGMTEVIIANLAKISALKVISRTSAMRYKGTTKSLPEIGRELKVDAIIEGSVLLMGDRVRITTQLIKAAEDKHIWAESYERDLSDVLALQHDVARTIANEIKIELTAREKVMLAGAKQVDPEAYQAYLKGRYHWNKRTKPDLEKSIVYFKQAIDRDPDYALAYAGLADAYIVVADWGYVPPIESRKKAKLYAERALALDNSLAEARTALAALNASLDWDFEKSEEGYIRAIELNPNYATAHQWYAELLFSTGRFDEALSEIGTALQLDPLSIVMNFVKGTIYYFARRYDEAIKEYETTLELDEYFSSARYFLFFCYYQKGMYKESVEEYKKALIIDGTGAEKAESLEKAFKQTGKRGADLWIIEELDETLDQYYNAPYYYAQFYARLGEIDKAIEQLERAFEVGSVNIQYIAVDPDLDNLRSDARFKDLIRRVGLPEISRVYKKQRG